MKKPKLPTQTLVGNVYVKSNYNEKGKPKNLVKATYFQWILKNEFDIPVLGVEGYAKFIDALATDPTVDIFTKLKYSKEISCYHKFSKKYNNGKWEGTNLRELMKFGRP